MLARRHRLALEAPPASVVGVGAPLNPSTPASVGKGVILALGIMGLVAMVAIPLLASRGRGSEGWGWGGGSRRRAAPSRPPPPPSRGPLLLMPYLPEPEPPAPPPARPRESFVAARRRRYGPVDLETLMPAGPRRRRRQRRATVQIRFQPEPGWNKIIDDDKDDT